MELGEYADMIIGREIDGEGLPKHARKRLTIAIQLVTMPGILFADEPTTGLGTVAANIVMRALRRCTAKLNLITAATIHQPSKLIWDAFDDLLLMVKGGNVAYMGDIGDRSSNALEYFSEMSGMEVPANVNPADYVLSAVSSVSDATASTTFRESSMYKVIMPTLEAEASLELDLQSTDLVAKSHCCDAGYLGVVKYTLLVKRHYLTQWRNPSYSLLRLVVSTLMPPYIGVLFIGDKSTLQGAVFSHWSNLPFGFCARHTDAIQRRPSC
jgi:hypothetical protein